MSIEAAIRTLLINDSALSAIISSRVYPEVLPQNPTFPAITIRIESDDPTNLLNNEQSSFMRSVLYVDSWAGTFTTADDMRVNVKRVLNSFQGVSESKRINLIRYSDRVGLYEQGVDSFRSTAIFNIFYYED